MNTHTVIKRCGIYCCWGILCFSLIAHTIPAYAMGKRPLSADKAARKEFVLPEIEIISKPEANTQLLSGGNDQSVPEAAPIAVSPKDVLPAVGNDINATLRSYRTADIQQALINAGFEPGAVDGKMGQKTKTAIRHFQEKNGLTIDGVVGKQTWEKLQRYISQPTKKSSH